MYLKKNKEILRTKIVATIGEPENMFNNEGNFIKGKINFSNFFNWFFQDPQHFMIDIIRINMSWFKDGKAQEEIFKWMEKNKKSAARNVAILGDLPGPKTRLVFNKFMKKELDKADEKNGVKITEKELTINFGEVIEGKNDQYPSASIYNRPFSEVVEMVENFRTIHQYIQHQKIAGSTVRISLGDGAVHLKVIDSTDEGLVTCHIEKGEYLQPNKGITIIGASLELPSFGEKDQEALDFLLKNGRGFVGFIGLSFVKNADDVLKVKNRMEKILLDIKLEENGLTEDRATARELEQYREEVQPSVPLLIAKIETKQAQKNIDEILDVADGIMVARGDLALQCGPEKIPAIQKKIIQKCNILGKPVITATQMLMSMTENLSPTRAETTDVFNAILDGTTAVMLSDETSSGKYPSQAVQTMADIAEAAEEYLDRKNIDETTRKNLNRLRFQEIRSGSESLLQNKSQRLERDLAAAGAHSNDRTCSDEWRKYNKWKVDFYSNEITKNRRQGIIDSISESACILSEEKKFHAIFVSTLTGRTARMVARYYPGVKIIASVNDEKTRRKMLLCYGVYPINIGEGYKNGPKFSDIDDVFKAAAYHALKHHLIRDKKSVIFVAGTPLWRVGEANLIQIKQINSKELRNLEFE